MKVKDVTYGKDIIALKDGGKKYIRLNVTRNTVDRDPSETVLANVDTGKLRVVSKDDECSVTHQIVPAASAAVSA